MLQKQALPGLLCPFCQQGSVFSALNKFIPSATSLPSTHFPELPLNLLEHQTGEASFQ